MIVIGDYSIEQFIQQNKIVITLPQTGETVTNTTIPFSHRKTKLTDAELAMILITVIIAYERANAPWPENRDDEYLEERERERKEKGMRR